MSELSAEWHYRVLTHTEKIFRNLLVNIGLKKSRKTNEKFPTHIVGPYAARSFIG